MSNESIIYCPVCFEGALVEDAISICPNCCANVIEAGGWVQIESKADAIKWAAGIHARVQGAGATRIAEAIGEALIPAISAKGERATRWALIAMTNAVRALEAEFSETMAVCDGCRHAAHTPGDLVSAGPLRGLCARSYEKREVCAGNGPLWAASAAHDASIRDMGYCAVPNCRICADDEARGQDFRAARGTGDAGPDGGDEQPSSRGALNEVLCAFWAFCEEEWSNLAGLQDSDPISMLEEMQKPASREVLDAIENFEREWPWGPRDGADEQEHFDDPCGGRRCDECEIGGCPGPNDDEARAEALLEELIDNDTVEFFLARLVESVTIDEIADGLLAGLSTWGRGELAKRLALVGSPVKRPNKQFFVIGPDGGSEVGGDARGTGSEKPEKRG